MIELYTAATPNGWKASVMLEEVKLEYQVFPLELSKQEQKQKDFLAINPNGRIPAIVDKSAEDFAVFESGAILIYLAEKTQQLLPGDEKKRSQVLQWLMFQMGGVGPMMGQANVFYRYFPEKIPAVISRYQNESRRLLEVLNSQLEHHEYLAGEYSIADIANWCWAMTHEWSGVSIDGLAHLQRWLNAVENRPAVKRGVLIPSSLNDKLGSEEKEAAFIDGARNILQR